MKCAIQLSGFIFVMGMVVACSYAPAAPPAAPLPTRAAQATQAPILFATATGIPLTRVAMPEPTDTPASFKAFSAVTPEQKALPTLTRTPFPSPRIGIGELGMFAAYEYSAVDLAVSRLGNSYAWVWQDWAGEEQQMVYPGLMFLTRIDLLRPRHLDANHPIALAVESKQERVVTGSVDGDIEIWNARTGMRDFGFGRITGQPTSIALSEDDRLVAVGARGRFQGGDGSVTIWKKEDANVLKLLPSYGAVTRLAFAGDDTLYISSNASSCARGGGGIFAWDGVSSEAKQVFSAHGNSVIDFAIHPQGKIIASVGQVQEPRCTGNATISIWDVSNGKLLWQNLPSATSVAFSPNGDRLAVGDVAGRVQVLDWQLGRVLATFDSDSSATTRIVFLTDQVFAYLNQDGYIRVQQFR